jgi:hypothetical protein
VTGARCAFIEPNQPFASALNLRPRGLRPKSRIGAHQGGSVQLRIRLQTTKQTRAALVEPLAPFAQQTVSSG